jgi:hypothetical protein
MALVNITEQNNDGHDKGHDEESGEVGAEKIISPSSYVIRHSFCELKDNKKQVTVRT